MAIEPLNRRETNLINAVAEAAALAERIAHPAVSVLSDLYHVVVEAEPFAATARAAALLTHVHIAAPDRQMPLPGRDEPELRDFFLTLRSIGYDGRVSIEARWSGLEDAIAGLHLMRQLWASVQDATID